MGFSKSIVCALGALGLAAAVALAGDGKGTRTISFYHIHTKESLTVTYKRDGKYVPEALKQLNWFMRDWRENKSIEMDPETIDIIWEMHEELGSKEPVHVICGHRSRGTNEMLRKTRGGQASQSQHITGKAIDIHFPDVPARMLRYSAMVRERGGVGYYPTSAIPFVHVDTARVRSWPNMPRNELALLFPSGHTQHHPAGGGELTPSDVRAARDKGGDTAVQVASYFSLRSQPKPTILVADAGSAALPPLVPPKPVPAVRPARDLPAPEQRMALAAPPAEPGLQWKASPRPTGTPPEAAAKLVKEPTPAAPSKIAAKLPAPKLVSEPRLVERPSKFTPTDQERDALTALVAEANKQKQAPAKANTEVASLEPARQPPAPVVTDASEFIQAPEFDEDHPEELVYRPFPLAPLLTATASADDAALSVMQAPDLKKTLAMLDDDVSSPPMRLRPGQQMAELLWSKEFRGQAVVLSDLIAERSQSNDAGVTDRLVKTTAR